MATLRRDASVQVKILDDKSIFDILKENGIDPAAHLLAVQGLPNRLWDITFKKVENKRTFWPKLSTGSGYTISSYSNSATIVTVLHVPHELEDTTVRFVLSRYGKVLCGRFLTFREFPDVYNGIRQYQIELKEDIPSSIRLGGRNCWVRYRGQPRTCLKCGLRGHEVKDCVEVKCFKCQQIGHLRKDCPSVIVCNICEMEGHTYHKCPVSFANKIKPAPMKWQAGFDPIDVEQVSFENSIDVILPTSEHTECNFALTLTTPDDAPTQTSVVMETQSSQVSVITGVDTVSMDSTEVICDTPSHVATMTVVDTPLCSTPDNSQPTPSDCVPNLESMIQSQDSLFEVDETSQSPSPSLLRGMIKSSTLQADEVSSIVKGRVCRPKRKSASSPSTQLTKKDRSRSRIRFPSEEPLDTIKMTQIFIEDLPWHSCHAKGCKKNFSSYNALIDHCSVDHTDLPISSYPCVMKNVCSLSLSTPREWIKHIAQSHPEFVRKRDVDFFDNFFLKK